MSNQYFENNPNLTHQEYHLSLYFKGTNLNFISDNGIFSKKQIDLGSTILLKNIPVDKSFKNVLDVGCGVGIIGLAIAKVMKVKVDLVDVNLKAIELCNKNIVLNEINDALAFLSDTYQNVTDSYDLIVTNPPIRAGKEVVKKILLGAKDHLKEDGILLFVVKASHGAKSYVKLLNDYYQEVLVLAKDQDFWVIKATN